MTGLYGVSGNNFHYEICKLSENVISRKMISSSLGFLNLFSIHLFSYLFLTLLDLLRGVTMSGGARGKKQVWHPRVRNRSFGANVLCYSTVLKKVLVTVLGIVGVPRSDSAPGELCPPCLPRCAPGFTDS